MRNSANGVWKERERDRVGEEGFLGAIKDGCKHGVDLHAREIGGAYGLFF